MNSLTLITIRIGVIFLHVIFLFKPNPIYDTVVNLDYENIFHVIISIITTRISEIVSVSLFQNLIHKIIYMLLAECVASDTDLDDKTEHTQATVGKEKYKNAEYDD